MKQLVLASSSQPRKEMLERAGIEFIVDTSDYKEDMSLDMEPSDLAMHLSQGKARDVATRHNNAVVLGADSFAVFKGRLLGKPLTKAKAKQMLSMLSSQKHSFITGFTLIDTESKREYSDFNETVVYFRKFTPDEIENYLAREDTLNHAGGYRSQGLGATLIDKIDGDLSNLMGLPITKVVLALRNFGITII